MTEGRLSRRPLSYSTLALNGLAQPLHGELDGSRREVAPDLDLGLELLLRISLEIFPYCPPGGRALPCEILADEWVIWHGAIKARYRRASNLRARMVCHPNCHPTVRDRPVSAGTGRARRTRKRQ